MRKLNYIISILYKYDYDYPLVWYPYSPSSISILYKYDYDMGRLLQSTTITGFQFYISTIMTWHRYALRQRQDHISILYKYDYDIDTTAAAHSPTSQFQFYISTIMTIA